MGFTVGKGASVKKTLCLFFITCAAGSLIALAFLTPQYPDEAEAILNTCDGYFSYGYFRGAQAKSPAKLAPWPEFSFPGDTESVAGSAKLHPVAWAGSVLEHQCAVNDRASLEKVHRSLEELLLHAQTTPKGNLVFPYRFDWPFDYEVNPWYSAMAQAMAGAAFMAGWRIFDDPRYYAASIRAIEAIRVESDSYHFYRITQNGVWFKEYPNNPYAVLDGSLIAICAIHDVWRSLPSDSPFKALYKEMYMSGLAGFKDEWARFKAPYGIYFDDSKRRVTPDYYAVNMAVLRQLGLTDPEIEDIRRRLIMPEGFFYRYLATASGAFFKITRTWWPHKPIGSALTEENIPPFAKPVINGMSKCVP